MYLPLGNSAQKIQYRSSCLQDIHVFLTKHNKDQIILCGDFNMVLHQIKKVNPLLSRHDHHKLTDMLDVHSIVYAYRSLHPFTISCSYSSKNTASCIDWIYISRSTEQKIQQSSYEVHSISFQTFLVWTLLLTVHTKNSSPLQSILLRHQCTCCTIPTTSGKPPGSLLV